MIDRLNETIIEERIKIYLENSTYTYIKDIFDYNFNGYIKENKEGHIIFCDDKLNIIPINKSDIKVINISTKNDK